MHGLKDPPPHLRNQTTPKALPGQIWPEVGEIAQGLLQASPAEPECRHPRIEPTSWAVVRIIAVGRFVARCWDGRSPEIRERQQELKHS